MASAVLEAQSLIQSANLNELDNIYVNNLPQELSTSDNTDSTYCLITHVRSDENIAGNVDFYALDREIEVQVVYKLDLTEDVENFELALLKLFKKNYWSLTDSRGHTVDPDTQQLTATFYLTQLKILN